MGRRTALAAALLMLPAVASSASSTPRCPLISDPRGDSAAHPWLAEEGFLGDPSLDLISADLASTSKEIVATIRVDRLQPATSGVSYLFSFNLGGRSYALSAVRAVDGDNFTAYGPGEARSGSTASLPYLGEITGRISTDTSQVHVHVPRALLGRPQQRSPLTEISVETARYVGTAGRVRGSDTTEYGTTGNSHPSDEAAAPRAWVVGEPPC